MLQKKEIKTAESAITQTLLASYFNRSLSSTTEYAYYNPQQKKSLSFSVSKLPSKKHALLIGSRDLIKRIGRRKSSSFYLENNDQDTSLLLPLCYLLHQPVKLEDVTIQSTEGITQHVLVCLHREVINLFKFIYNLRSIHIKADELQDIVLLCSNRPSEKIFDIISIFPKVYFMEVKKV